MSGIDRKNEGNAGRRLCTARHCRSESLEKVETSLRAISPARPVPKAPSAKLGSWRKAKKARTSSAIGHFHPPSANSYSWRRGSNFPRKRPLFANFGHHLAECVKFPEKNAGFWITRF